MTVLIADGIAFKVNRFPAHVLNSLGFFVEKRMYPMRRENEKRILPADVLQVCHPPAFAPAALKLGGGNLVFGEELFINYLGVFVLGDCALDIEPVSAPDVAHSELLNEPTHSSCSVMIIHS